ncbi:MAG: hypothetical protein K2X69_00370, partial [Silvanigrellaceae bacterium]|nr:hypothetical protein [Silvanigrellaceae bacterium]
MFWISEKYRSKKSKKNIRKNIKKNHSNEKVANYNKFIFKLASFLGLDRLTKYFKKVMKAVKQESI